MNLNNKEEKIKKMFIFSIYLLYNYFGR